MNFRLVFRLKTTVTHSLNDRHYSVTKTELYNPFLFLMHAHIIYCSFLGNDTRVIINCLCNCLTRYRCIHHHPLIIIIFIFVIGSKSEKLRQEEVALYFLKINSDQYLLDNLGRSISRFIYHRDIITHVANRVHSPFFTGFLREKEESVPFLASPKKISRLINNIFYDLLIRHRSKCVHPEVTLLYLVDY